MVIRTAAAAILAVVAACASPLESTGPTASASIRCDPSGTWAQVEAVRARPDGVHLSIENTAERSMSVYGQVDQDIRPLGPVEAGTSENVVTTMPPTAWRLLCLAGDAYPDQDAPWAELLVVDPDGVWVSDVLDCDVSTASHPDYVEDFEGGTPQGQTGEPESLAREGIAASGFPVLADDVLERAGYPESEPVHVRLVRDGRIMAIGSYHADGEGGWIDRGAEYCEA